jgi:hypothetical protein
MWIQHGPNFTTTINIFLYLIFQFLYRRICLHDINDKIANGQQLLPIQNFLRIQIFGIRAFGFPQILLAFDVVFTVDQKTEKFFL